MLQVPFLDRIFLSSIIWDFLIRSSSSSYKRNKFQALERKLRTQFLVPNYPINKHWLSFDHRLDNVQCLPL